MATISDNYRRRPAGSEHQTTYKFDKAADTAAQEQFQPLFDTEGRKIVMPGVQRARIKAQVESHKNPKNRAG
jgi:hypothetical protein